MSGAAILRRGLLSLLSLVTVIAQTMRLDAYDPLLIRLLGPAYLMWFGIEMILILRKERPQDEEH